MPAHEDHGAGKTDKGVEIIEPPIPVNHYALVFVPSGEQGLDLPTPLIALRTRSSCVLGRLQFREVLALAVNGLLAYFVPSCYPGNRATARLAQDRHRLFFGEAAFLHWLPRWSRELFSQLTNGPENSGSSKEDPLLSGRCEASAFQCGRRRAPDHPTCVVDDHSAARGDQMGTGGILHVGVVPA